MEKFTLILTRNFVNNILEKKGISEKYRCVKGVFEQYSGNEINAIIDFTGKFIAYVNKENAYKIVSNLASCKKNKNSMRHNKLNALNCKLKKLLPTIQDFRANLSDSFDALTFYKNNYLTHCDGFCIALKQFRKILKKLSTQLAKYAKINAERRKYRIFVKCTQFSLF